jgi:hypothetical protein
VLRERRLGALQQPVLLVSMQRPLDAGRAPFEACGHRVGSPAPHDQRQTEMQSSPVDETDAA